MQNILLVPHPKLRAKAETINKISEKEIKIAEKMIEIMKKAPGVGLAANQIGILKKIITVHIFNEEKKINKTYALFNPIIKSYSKETIVMEEGCLSLPGQFAEIERPAECTLKYVDYNGREKELKADGLLATCIQHEVDHLNGILFIDYLSKLKKDMIIKKLVKSWSCKSFYLFS